MQSLLLSFALILQVATLIPPIRLGEIGGKLSSEDIAAIERIAEKTGAKPWLFIGQLGPIKGWWHVQVYLPPDQKNPDLRRGQMLAVSTTISDVSNSPKEWKMQGKAIAFAQVEIPGRQFDELRDTQDTNLPFRVLGEISDEGLVRVVQFIRSHLPGRYPWASDTVVVPSGLPIDSITAYSDGSAYVSLRINQWQGFGVTLRPSKGAWVVTNVVRWIV